MAQHAAWEEVQRAYRERVRLYHPDRLAGLGEELIATAERKTKELNAAYATAKRIRAR